MKKKRKKLKEKNTVFDIHMSEHVNSLVGNLLSAKSLSLLLLGMYIRKTLLKMAVEINFSTKIYKRKLVKETTIMTL